MKYIQFKIHASRQGIEAVMPILLANGVDGISVEDPADLKSVLAPENPYAWDYVEGDLIDTNLSGETLSSADASDRTVIDDSLSRQADREPVLSAWLEDTEANRVILQNIKIDILKLKAEEQYQTFGPDADFGRLYVETETVDDEAWKDRWKENFKPVKVTDRIVVKPTWEPYEAKAGELVLEIDPGSAFGTGTHETTSLCMKLLEKYAAGGDAAGGGTAPVETAVNTETAGGPAAGLRVIDVGCGSGILSVAAALIGCPYVLGTEIDPEAVAVAWENAELNGVLSNVKVFEADLLNGINYKADIILANLMHHLVIRLAPDAYRHLNPGGIFISSGILLEKRDQVAAAVEAAGFEILEIPEDGEWCAIAARRYA